MRGGLAFSRLVPLLLVWAQIGMPASAFAAPVVDDANPPQSETAGPTRTRPQRNAPNLPSLGENDIADDEDQDETGEFEESIERQVLFQQHVMAAEAATRAGNPELAVREYSEANKLQPGDPGVLIGRAEARFARSGAGRCPRSAISDLLSVATYDPRGRWLEQRGRVLEWMQSCGDDYFSERLQIARELAAERPGAPGRPDDVMVVLADLEYMAAERAESKAEQDDRRAAVLDVLERYRNECKKLERKPALRALRLQGAINRELDRLDEAIDAYEALRKLYPRGPEARETQDWLQELRDEKTLREWERSQGGKPTPQAERDYQKGAAALRRGDLAAAETYLTAAREQSPWYARANYALGVVQARNGRLEEAVESLEKAILADRSDYQARVKLGLIYKQEFGGTKDDEARRHLETALRLRPDLDVLHLHLGELYARTNRERARSHYRRFIDRAEPSDPNARKARQALDDLDRTIRENEPLTVPPPPKESLRYLEPDLQRLINEAYLKGTEQNNWERAEQILRDARTRYPDEPVVVNELAKVMYAQSRFGDARTFWEQSLQMKSNQLHVHEQLGLLLEGDLPTEALPHLRQAAEASPVARFHLARLLWEQRDPFAASQQLDRYLLEADKHDLYWLRAGELRQEMDRTFLYGGLAAGLLLSFLIGVPAWRLYRRWRGASLSQLLENHPKCFPEVARILSLIRHEILKHNTAFLADVGRAIEYEAPDADHRAFVLGRRLFGDIPKSKRAPRVVAWEAGGIYGRFLGYVQELELVARNHGVRLNLYRKDPIFRPMMKAFESLRTRASELRSAGDVRHSRRLELARTLSKAGHVLGRQAFSRLSGLIQALCVVDVDPPFLWQVYEQVIGEEQFATIQTAPLQIDGQGARVRVFRTDLEDILSNILRNSLRSSVKYARPPVGLGIGLVTEVDEITGLASLAIRIKDRSPEQLSNEMLRGRYVERGMGITVDLLSRYDGSIGVEPEAGWEKAVVLRFFTLEDQIGVDQEPGLSMKVAS